MVIASPAELKKAQIQLAANDPVLRPIITAAGPADLKPHTNYYSALVSSIISQQLSVKAAATIETRFKSLFGGRLPEPTEILTQNSETLRAAGLSTRKVIYIQDLAKHIENKNVDFSLFNTLSNEAIVSELTDVKGIGEWTAHMFLMFCMGRLDVLPVGDLGIRSGIRKLYKLDRLPFPEQIEDIANTYKWKPYQSVACWYIWHALDNKPA